MDEVNPLLLIIAIILVLLYPWTDMLIKGYRGRLDMSDMEQNSSVAGVVAFRRYTCLGCVFAAIAVVSGLEAHFAVPLGIAASVCVYPFVQYRGWC